MKQRKQLTGKAHPALFGGEEEEEPINEVLIFQSTIHRHTHSKHIFQFTVDIQFQNAIMLHLFISANFLSAATKTAKARTLCVYSHFVCPFIPLLFSYMLISRPAI